MAQFQLCSRAAKFSILPHRVVTITTNVNAAVLPVTGFETLPLTAQPQASPGAGTYTSAVTVTITDSTAGAAIYYTTDGSTPTTSSTPYNGPITVSQPENIQAIAVASGYAPSTILSASYLLPVDFSVSASPSSITISTGSPGKVTVSITPQNGFSSQVSFACSGLPSGTSCSFQPSTVTPSGGVATTTLTLSTMATSAAQGSLLPVAALLLAFCCFGSAGRRRGLRTTLLMAAFALSLLVGCSSASSSPPPPVTKTITVTATAGTLQHTTTFVLTVQ